LLYGMDCGLQRGQRLVCKQNYNLRPQQRWIRGWGGTQSLPVRNVVSFSCGPNGEEGTKIRSFGPV
jgi:hypothetical protein